MARLERSVQAEIDLTEIAFNVANQSQSLDVAHRLLERIEDACRTLANSPGIGQARPEFATGRLRSWTVGNYVVYYEPLDDGIRVVRVLHGARDHQSLL